MVCFWEQNPVYRISQDVLVVWQFTFREHSANDLELIQKTKLSNFKAHKVFRHHKHNVYFHQVEPFVSGAWNISSIPELKMKMILGAPCACSLQIAYKIILYSTFICKLQMLACPSMLA